MRQTKYIYLILFVYLNPKFNRKVQYLLFISIIRQIVTLESTSPKTGFVG